MYFLTIPFSYSAANIRPNDMIAGMPAMSAVSGMVHNVERLLRDQLDIPSFRCEAFSLIYFNLDRDIASPRRPPEGLGGGSDMKLPALVDIRRAHGEAMLVVNFQIPSDQDADRFAGLVTGPDGLAHVESILSARLRFSGGEMFFGLPGEFGNSPLNVGISQSWGEVLGSMRKAYPTQGLLVQDMHHLVTKTALDKGVSTLDAVADLIYQSKLAMKSGNKQTPEAELNHPGVEIGQGVEGHETVDPDDMDLLDLEDGEVPEIDEDAKVMDETEGSNLYLGVLLPCAVGFHEVCAGHDGHSGCYPHVYVESVLSLVRIRSVASVARDIRQNRAPWQSHFWRWEHLPEHRLYRAVSFSE
jgi:hypothetical protein